MLNWQFIWCIGNIGGGYYDDWYYWSNAARNQAIN